MSRIRAIHPRAPLDDDVASLPMDARLLWAYLPCYADKEGRMEDRLLALKGAVFPGDNVDVSAMLTMFEHRGFIIRFEAEGRRLIQINHFHRYQRPDHHERTSQLPAPANWEPAQRYGSTEENAQATPRQRPGKPTPTPTCAPDCQGKAAPGLRDSGTPVIPDQADPRARSNPPANEHGKPTARNVVDLYLRLRAELVVGHVQGANGIFQQPQPGDVAKASEWLASVAPEECADIEPAIRLACQHVAAGAQGWARPEMAKVGYLFGCIVRSWPDLREELHGCAPKLKTVDRNGKPERESEVTPVKEW
jgi:hypothetical protein